MSFRKLALWIGPLLFVGVLFFWPVSKIVALGLSGSWLDTLTDSTTLEAIWFTIWQAALSTVLCLLLGIPGAYVLYRKSFRGQRFVRALITIPLVLPTIIVAISFTAFRAVHGMYEAIGLGFIVQNPIYWIIAAHVFVNYSITVRTIGGVWATLDNETEEAAAMAGAGRLRTLISITLPQLKPAVVSAAALTFLFCSTSFGIILILGGGQVNSIETEISLAVTQFLDLEKAATLALLQTALTIVAFTISENITKGAVGLEQVDEGRPKPPIDRRDWPVVAVTSAVVVGLVAMPIVVVLSRAFIVGDGPLFGFAFGLDNFANLAGRGDRDVLNISVGQATLNTLRNVSISTTIAVILGTTVAYLLSRPVFTRLGRISRRTLDVMFLLPMGISSVVLGFGYLITFGDGAFALRSSWLVVPLVQALMALPLVIRLIYPALISIGSDQREAASTAGATAAQTWWLIESPMIRGVITTAIGYALIVSLGEFGAASLLAYGDQATLPTVLYQLISRPGSTNYGMAMAVSALMILLTLALVFSVSLRKKPEHQTSKNARGLLRLTRRFGQPK